MWQGANTLRIIGGTKRETIVKKRLGHPTSRVPHKDVRHPTGGRDANVRRHIPLMSCFLLKTSYLCIFLLLFLLFVDKIFKFGENEV